MKDLEPSKTILGIRICRTRKRRSCICMSHERYINKVLESFHMDKAKVVSSPLSNHFKLRSNQSPQQIKRKRYGKYSKCLNSRKFNVCNGV